MRIIDHRQFARRKPRPRRWLRITTWSAAVAVGLLLALNATLWVLYRNSVPPRYSVGTAAVGGVKLRDIDKHVTAATVLPADITLQFQERTVQVAPAELGIRSDTAATIARVKDSRPLLPMMSLFTHHTVPVQVAVDDAVFTKKAIALQSIFSKTPTGKHIVYHDGGFQIAEPEAGYALDVTNLKTAVIRAAASGKVSVAVPTTALPAPTSSVDLQPDVQKLQKQLTTAIHLVYGDQTRKPTADDIGHWYAPDGPSMAPSRQLITQYVQNMAKQLGVTLVNADEAATAGIYALGKNQPLSFRLAVEQGTVVYRYCAAQRGLDDSVLAAFKLKLAATYGDTRGWNDNGRIAFIYSDSGCQLHAWLAAPAAMASFGSICDDYYSCTVYPNVIINNDRWNGATDPWNAQHLGIEDYRAMAINHESGHWLGFDHVTCPGTGQPAPVMMQQSINLGGCTFNPWPLVSETAKAAR